MTIDTDIEKAQWIIENKCPKCGYELTNGTTSAPDERVGTIKLGNTDISVVRTKLIRVLLCPKCRWSDND